VFAAVACCFGALPTIQPAVAADFTTYIGDSLPYQVAAIVTDTTGNTYVTGSRVITNAATDVFVAKVDPSGSVVFTTTFGGKAQDQATSIALDPAGNIWVGGSTSSDNFPLHDAFQTDFSGATTGFLVKLAPDGTVIYSSYFGGSQRGQSGDESSSTVNGVATDQSGNVYVTGETNSGDFPTTAGMPAGEVSPPVASGGVSGAFVAKLSPNGLQILYSGLIVGNSPVCYGGSSCFLSARSAAGIAISVDPAGNAYIAGNTNTSDLPVTAGAFLSTGYGPFAAKVNAAGNGLAYLTYLVPAPPLISVPFESTDVTSIAVDSSGNAYLAGMTNDPDFPVSVGAFQSSCACFNSQNAGTGPETYSAYVAKLNATGTAIVWATYLGGPVRTQANSLSLDSSGNVWVAGTTTGGFPGASLWFTNGPGDFLAELKSDGSGLSYSAVFPAGSIGQAIAGDDAGLIHAAGQIGLLSVITPQQPLAPRIFGIMNSAAGPFSASLAPGELISVYGFGIGPSTAASGTPDSNGLYPKSLGGVQMLIGGVATPLLYVSSTQINAQVPFALTGPDNTTVSITNSSSTLPAFLAVVDPAIPGIFTIAGGSAAVNQDGTLNSAANPAKTGSVVSIWVTGTGEVSGVDGQVATAAGNTCVYCQVSVNGATEMNGLSLALYAGAAPGIIDGVSQINFTVPSLPNSTTNSASVTLAVGTAVSPPMTLYVTQ
jgi:uncharacterized protein (TIGR03437 family)